MSPETKCSQPERLPRALERQLTTLAQQKLTESCLHVVFKEYIGDLALLGLHFNCEPDSHDSGT